MILGIYIFFGVVEKKKGEEKNFYYYIFQVTPAYYIVPREPEYLRFTFLLIMPY